MGGKGVRLRSLKGLLEERWRGRHGRRKKLWSRRASSGMRDLYGAGDELKMQRRSTREKSRCSSSSASMPLHSLFCLFSGHAPSPHHPLPPLSPTSYLIIHLPPPSLTLWLSFSLPLSAFIRLTLSHSRKRHPPAPPSLCCSAQVKSILEMERERRKKDLKIEKLKLRGWPFILSFLLPSLALLVPCPPSLRCVKVTSLNRLRQ
jgi:hypothetical protein